MAARLIPLFTLCAGLLSGVSPAAGETGAPATREGVVYAASYFQSASRCDGDTHPVHIRIEANPAPRIQLGFFESSAGAIGPQWRTAGWMAALVATTLLGQDLHRHRISYTLEGLIDGPSAGALTTVGLLTLMRGAHVPDDVSMTGAVNPDGTIGPVGGIPQKIRGAARSGKKRFAVPLGQRRDTNLCTGNDEDVIELGRALGVEVVEVGDVREAYAFLTGERLPAPAIKPIALALPDDIRSAFKQLNERWLERYRAAGGIVRGAQAAEFTPEFRSLWQVGEQLAAAAGDELASGHEAAAFNRVWLAVLNAEVTARGVSAMRVLLTQGFPGLHAFVQQQLGQIDRQLTGTATSLRGVSVNTSVDAGAVTLIGGNLAAALAALEHADQLLQRSIALARNARPENYPEVGLLAFQALGQATLAALLADAAVETRGWLGRGGPPLPVGARGGLEQIDRLPGFFAQDYAAAYAQLGALLMTVSNSALLVAQHYSLAARTDNLGRVVGFGREAAVARMSELADQEALRAIGEAAGATGGASTPMLAATLDAARRSRDVSVTAHDRLMALGLYWNATLTARLITELSQPL